MYRESDNYTDLSYANLISGEESLPAVNTEFSQSVTFESDADSSIDTPMYLTNQAMFGVWYQKNAAM